MDISKVIYGYVLFILIFSNNYSQVIAIHYIVHYLIFVGLKKKLFYFLIYTKSKRVKRILQHDIYLLLLTPLNLTLKKKKKL